MTLAYDTNGNVFALKLDQGKRYFLASDLQGTPLQLFQSDGRAIIKIRRAPFGLKIEEKVLRLLTLLTFRVILCSGIY